MKTLSKFLRKYLLFLCGLLVMTSTAIVGCDFPEDESQDNADDDSSDNENSLDDAEKDNSVDDAEKGDSVDDAEKDDSVDDAEKDDSVDDAEENNNLDDNDKSDEETDDDKESDQDNASDQTEDASETDDSETTTIYDCRDLKLEFDRFDAEWGEGTVECNNSMNASVSDEITGPGKLIDIPYNLEGFSKISVECTFVVEVQAGTDFGVVVTIDDNLQQFVNVYQENDWLFIDADTDGHRVKDVVMRAVVTMPALTELKTSGVNLVFVPEAVTTDADITFDVSGASHLWGCLDASSLDMKSDGASYAQLSGAADDVQLSADGTAEIDLADLEAKSTQVDIGGAVHAEVTFLESLTGDVSGVGHLCYSGDSSLVNVTTESFLSEIEKCEN